MCFPTTYGIMRPRAFPPQAMPVMGYVEFAIAGMTRCGQIGCVAEEKGRTHLESVP
jgi:hypothetical protein